MNINITEKAKEEMRKVLENKNSPNQPLRIYIAGVGWGGPSFGIALDEQKEEDQMVEVDDFKFVVEKDILSAYSNFNIDYSNNWLRRGFYVTSDRDSQC